MSVIEKRVYYLAGCLLFLWACGGNIPRQVPPQSLFDTEEVLQLTLISDMEAMLNDVGKKRRQHKAVLEYKNKQGILVALPVKVKTRGKFRRDADLCDFPPLKISFLAAAETIFRHQTSLKLVTHCQTDSLKYEQYLLQEYLSYKTYNLLTNKSFRVRLARIAYKDLYDGFDPIIRYAFFVEDAQKMAARNGGRLINKKEKKSIEQEETDYFLMTQMAVFQYLIGNTDWSVSSRHNVKLISAKGHSLPIPVPYDFDYTGLLNIYYASHSPELQLKSIRQRSYRGYCRSEAYFKHIFGIFEQNKDSLVGLYQNFPLLNDFYKKKSVAYLQSFYSDTLRLKTEVTKNCYVYKPTPKKAKKK